MDKIYNAIIFLLLFASAAMACLFYVKWLGVREENIERRLDESRLRYNVAKLSDEKAYKEEYYYRSIFSELFPSNSAALSVPSVPSVACSSAEALAWDPSFKNMNDPSGRAVKGVHEAALE